MAYPLGRPHKILPQQQKRSSQKYTDLTRLFYKQWLNCQLSVLVSQLLKRLISSVHCRTDSKLKKLQTSIKISNLQFIKPSKLIPPPPKEKCLLPGAVVDF